MQTLLRPNVVSNKLLSLRNFQNSGFLSPVTGPLNLLSGYSIIVLADVENLSYSAKNLGYQVLYKKLATKISEVSSSSKLHAFFSADHNEDELARLFLETGWIPHIHHIEIVQTYKGTERLANSDNLILFRAGQIAANENAEIFILASGDGKLVSDLAKFLTSLPSRPRVLTLSLPGSTSFRLNADANQHICSNLEIGLDCLKPLYAEVA